MNVVGLDLSLTGTGVARADGTTETLKTSLRGMPRVSWLVNEIITRAVDDRADVVVTEDCIAMRNGSVVPLAMLHGAVRLRLFHCDLPTVVLAPATLKKFATGKGNAPKPDMRMALYKRTEIDLPDDNQDDAWWLRAAGRQWYGAPVLFVPQAQLDALVKVEWPSLEAVGS